MHRALQHHVFICLKSLGTQIPLPGRSSLINFALGIISLGHSVRQISPGGWRRLKDARQRCSTLIFNPPFFRFLMFCLHVLLVRCIWHSPVIFCTHSYSLLHSLDVCYTRSYILYSPTIETIPHYKYLL